MFVWTISDAIGLGFVALLVLLGLVIAGLYGAQKLERKVKSLWKHK